MTRHWARQFYKTARAPTPWYTTVPEGFVMRCPRCGGRALFDEPFEYWPADHGIPESDGRPVHSWDRWYVREKYPSVLRFSTGNGTPHPWGSYALQEKGIVKCTNCHLVAPHKLEWPRDAYYRWEINGALLWAISLEHAQVLLAYLGNTQRAAHQFPAYWPILCRLPKRIIKAGAREKVVRAISATLERETR